MSKGRHIRTFDYVNHPYDQVRAALRDGIGDVLRGATHSAASRAYAVATELHVNIGGIDVGTEIAVDVWSIDEDPKGPLGGATTRIELEWEAAKAARLFPFMKGRLSAYALGARETQLDFEGDYEPPLGLVGSALDSVVGHRIAEASVRRFITDVATHLRETLD